MKKLLTVLAFAVQIAQAQTQYFGNGNLVVTLDTNKTLETYQRGYGFTCYSLFATANPANISNANRIFDCWDGNIFLFPDTLVSGDVAQIGTSGRFKLTPHSSQVNTTKRNIFLLDGAWLISWDTSIQEIHYGADDGGNYPILIKRISDGRIMLRIEKGGVFEIRTNNIPATFGSVVKISL